MALALEGSYKVDNMWMIDLPQDLDLTANITSSMRVGKLVLVIALHCDDFIGLLDG